MKTKRKIKIKKNKKNTYDKVNNSCKDKEIYGWNSKWKVRWAE